MSSSEPFAAHLEQEQLFNATRVSNRFADPAGIVAKAGLPVKGINAAALPEELVFTGKEWDETVRSELVVTDRSESAAKWASYGIFQKSTWKNWSKSKHTARWTRSMLEAMTETFSNASDEQANEWGDAKCVSLAAALPALLHKFPASSDQPSLQLAIQAWMQVHIPYIASRCRQCSAQRTGRLSQGSSTKRGRDSMHRQSSPELSSGDAESDESDESSPIRSRRSRSRHLHQRKSRRKSSAERSPTGVFGSENVEPSSAAAGHTASSRAPVPTPTTEVESGAELASGDERAAAGKLDEATDVENADPRDCAATDGDEEAGLRYLMRSLRVLRDNQGVSSQLQAQMEKGFKNISRRIDSLAARLPLSESNHHGSGLESGSE